MCWANAGAVRTWGVRTRATDRDRSRRAAHINRGLPEALNSFESILTGRTRRQKACIFRILFGDAGCIFVVNAIRYSFATSFNCLSNAHCGLP